MTPLEESLTPILLSFLCGASLTGLVWYLCHYTSPVRSYFTLTFRQTSLVRIVRPTDTTQSILDEMVSREKSDATIDQSTPNSDYYTCGYKMSRDDWKPLIAAMEYLRYVPECGDVAIRLLDIFKAARAGHYYWIEMGYEGPDGQCWVIQQDFNVKEAESNSR